MVSCDDDDDDNVLTPPTENEEEVITQLIMTFVPTTGGNPVIFNFLDADGDGPIDPVITNGTLDSNTNYTASIQLFNTLENPADTITFEILEEDDEHQFFFTTTVNGMTINYADMDDDMNPVGLFTTVNTTNAGTGNLNVILVHEPNKDAPGVSGGDITNAGGEIDIEVDFTVTVQ